MITTALSIIQAVRKRLNIPNITTLVGLTDPDELQMLDLLYSVCEELRQARCWTQLKRKHTFTTVDGQTNYQAPADFYSPLPLTWWNTDETQRLNGPESDSDFGERIYGAEPANINFSFRMFGHGGDPTDSTTGIIELSPTPSSAIDCAFEYISRTFILPSTYAFPASPKETVTADTDLVVFDDDLVKLGLKARWLEEAGGDWQGTYAEFKSRIDKAANRHKGSYLGSFSRRRGGPNLKIPYKSWDI